MLEKIGNALRARGDRSAARAGNGFRDQGAWRQAVAAYQEHLAQTPDDFALWVQLGNCAKEDGQLAVAKSAYAHASTLAPEDPDLHVQQGQLLKIGGDRDAAVRSYRRAFALDPANQAALQELYGLDGGDTAMMQAAAGPQAAGPVCWLDITDLMEYAKVNTSLSGIQRVVGNLVDYAARAAAGGMRMVPVVPEFDRFRMLAASLPMVCGLIRLIEQGGSDRRMIDVAVRAVYDSRVEVQPRAGDSFVMAGAFWICAQYDMVASLRRRGVRFAVFIHDLIQIRNPEYVQREATLVFQRRLIDVLTLSNFVLTNSAFVASEVRSYIAERTDFTISVEAVPLATELRVVDAGPTFHDPDILEVCKTDYVLCVCTIEVRKNHFYLVKIWEKLRREFKGKLPNLVFVGKWGWYIDDLRHHIDENGYVGDWLYIFNGISDQALAYLFSHCLMTAYVSFAEGFGLPVGESLAHGKPCIASNVTSIPEVGEDFVRYVDPFDLNSGYAMFASTLADRAGLQAWATRVKAEFRPKSWDSFGAEFVGRLEQLSAAEPELPRINVIVPAGRIAFAGDDALDAAEAIGTRLPMFRMARRYGWHGLTPWGTWASRRKAMLEFQTSLAEAVEIKLYLRLCVPADTGTAWITVKAGDVDTRMQVDETPRFVLVDGRIGAEGTMTVEITSSGRFPGAGDQTRYVGVNALAYCVSNDPVGRIDLLEQVSLLAASR